MRHVFVTFGPQLSSLTFSLTTGPHLDRTTSASVITEPNVPRVYKKKDKISLRVKVHIPGVQIPSAVSSWFDSSFHKAPLE